MDMNLIVNLGILAVLLASTSVVFILRAELKSLAQRQDAVWQELVEIKQTTANTHNIALQLYRFMGLSSSGNRGT